MTHKLIINTTLLIDKKLVAMTQLAQQAAQMKSMTYDKWLININQDKRKLILTGCKVSNQYLITENCERSLKRNKVWLIY
ncbi:MAG: hypothetical protein DRR08_05880 [Candidatus Parabeggiatoa sp. nov. 2]|nr:MAG: hypothetical protein B6247_09440 [Beggiatoa sp. 4572_84]RKZ62506.1 MAG: hypothetical protein DRR08_05880 [Gammaproteobacteria bacterium]